MPFGGNVPPQDDSTKTKVTQNQLWDDFLIYTHNISGFRTKDSIATFNNKLAIANFHIIAIQETWLRNQLDAEILAGSSYHIAQKDRSEFTNARTLEGGVILLVRNNLEFSIIDLPPRTQCYSRQKVQKTILNFQCVYSTIHGHKSETKYVFRSE